MKVYFAGSIRGGRADAALYRRMIAHIQKTDLVLTEHVGAAQLAESPSDAAIYAQDAAWLREAELLIAECSCPSLGVGYELAYAEAHGKSVHILYDRTRTALSAMLAGNPAFHLHPYERRDQIEALLDEILREERSKH